MTTLSVNQVERAVRRHPPCRLARWHASMLSEGAEVLRRRAGPLPSL